MYLYFDDLPGSHVLGHVDRVGLVTRQPKGGGVLSLQELQRNDTHTDKIWAMNPLERFRNDS